MADKITWNDKVSLVTDPTIAEINKVTDSNMNEIKSVTNTNADELTEKIVYDESDITENTGLIIEEVPEGSNIPYINSEIAIGSTNEDNRPVWFKKSKNLFSSSLELGTFSNEGVKSASSTNYRNATPIQVQPNTTYTFSINGVSQKYALYYYNNTNTFINSEDLTTGTFTTPANCYYINFRCFNADYTSDFANLKLQIEEGSTATTYTDYIAPSIIADNTEFYTKPEFKTGVVTWNTTNVTGDSNKNTWYKIGNIVIAILEFTPLSGKIANNNIICSGLPPAKAIFPYEEESRQYVVNQVGNCMWYYPTNTTNLNRIDTTIVYVTD